MPKQKHNDAWGADGAADEDRLTENRAAPVVRYSTFRRKAQRRLLKATIFVFAPLILLSLVGNLTAEKAVPPAAKASSTDANSSPGKAAATAAMQAWLESKPAPLPGARLLSWDGYRTLPKAAATTKRGTTGDDGGTTTEVDQFTLAVTDEKTTTLYSSSVEVRISRAGIASVTGTPTLLPTASNLQDGAASSAQTWSGWQSVTPNDAVSSSVRAWAEAFTGNDPDALRLVVGDPSKKHAYLPLRGADASDVKVTAAATKPAADGSNNDDPTTLIARVTFTPRWGSDADDSGRTVVTYDVLIAAANTASPRVVAWGGPGAGPALKPYSNAISAALATNNHEPAGARTTTPASDDGMNR